jgi:hypothetical protein
LGVVLAEVLEVVMVERLVGVMDEVLEEGQVEKLGVA